MKSSFSSNFYQNFLRERVDISSTQSTTYNADYMQPAFRPSITFESPSAIFPQIEVAQLLEVIERIKNIGYLKDNWDGYGGAAVSYNIVIEAIAVLEAHSKLLGNLSLPDVFPTPNGTISMEWQAGSAEAVIELGENKISGFVKADQSSATYFIDAPTGVFARSLPTVLSSLMNPQVPMAPSFSHLEIMDDERNTNYGS